MFLHLSFQIVDGLLNLVKDATFKCDILDDIHFTAYLFFSTIVSDEAYSCSGEEILRTFAEKKDAGGADLNTFSFICQETFILLKILHRGFSVTKPLHVCPDGIHINVIKGGIISRTVFIIAFSLIVHKLQAFLKRQLAGLVTYPPEHLVCLVGMKAWASRDQKN